MDPAPPRLGRAVAWTVALVMGAAAGVRAGPAPPWTGRLLAELRQVDERSRADLGVYVRELDGGASVSYQADETWYLASTVKLPVAIAVLRGVERGDFALDTLLMLRAADYVDGAGPTNSHRPGSTLSVRYLLEQMMVHSDNTASDLLIGLVGIAQVNALVNTLVPQGFQPITSLADVRRQVYGHLDPAAVRLSGPDFLLLKAQRSDLDRRRTLAGLLQVPLAELRLASVGNAYDAYYASGLNSGRLDAYGDLLALLADGKALGPWATGYLLALMERCQTGAQRIKAGLPTGVRFAHKTGTQSARTCDAGLVLVPRGGREQRVVVVACTRREFSLSDAERALRQVGTALCRSGVLSAGAPHGPACRTDPPGPGAAALRPGLDAP